VHRPEHRRRKSERQIPVQSMIVSRLSGGSFVEEHGQPDMLGMLQQIERCRQPGKPRRQSVEAKIANLRTEVG